MIVGQDSEDDDRPGRGGSAMLVLSALVVVLAVGLSFIHPPYAIYEPGPVTNTLEATDGTPVVTVRGARTYPTSGALDFTTVYVSGGPGAPVDGWDVLRAWADPAAEVVPRAEAFPPGASQDEIAEINTKEMANSQQEAIAVALRGLGRTVDEHVVVDAIEKGAPALGALEAGDRITAVDGRRVRTRVEAIRAIRARRVGATVRLSVVRDGTDRVVRVPTVGARVSGGGEVPVIGVILAPRFTFPFDVTIDAGEVGGPSAGMMLSLAVRDVLTPGAMTGGKQIAGTGTISERGSVGPIGGIEHKLVGARRAGAQWFLAPADNCSEVRGHVPDGLRVVRVSTHREAVDAVEAIAADRTGALPSC